MRPDVPPLQQVDRTYVLYQGKRLSYFSGCDYFRLASHPAILSVLRQSLKEFGLNVAASRITTGNHPLYPRLEEEIARFFGGEAAVCLSNGYLANLAAAQALAGQFSHALLDERAHSSLREAAKLLGCPIREFRHRSSEHLSRTVRALGRRSHLILLTDGMFSHDGSVAPLKAYLDALPKESVVLVDDAHAAGVLGQGGRGTPEWEGIPRSRVVQTITLSKAFGVYGGAVVAGRALCQRLVERSSVYAGNTPMPLPLAAAALTALELLGDPCRSREQLQRNTEHLKEALRPYDVPSADTPGPMAALNPRDARETMQIRKRLLAAGIYPPLVHYPGGPAGGYFRFALSSEHRPAQLDRLREVLIRLCRARL